MFRNCRFLPYNRSHTLERVNRYVGPAVVAMETAGVISYQDNNAGL